MAGTQYGEFAELRRQEILDRLQCLGKITVAELCEHFSLSPATIRNDLAELQRAGLLQRTHGGAIPAAGARPRAHPSLEKESRKRGEQAGHRVPGGGHGEPGGRDRPGHRHHHLRIGPVHRLGAQPDGHHQRPASPPSGKQPGATVFLWGHGCAGAFPVPSEERAGQPVPRTRIPCSWPPTASPFAGVSAPGVEVADIKRQFIAVAGGWSPWRTAPRWTPRPSPLAWPEQIDLSGHRQRYFPGFQNALKNWDRGGIGINRQYSLINR